MISRTSEGWKFLSEAALEKFVCENLKMLFSADLLKQQYNCNGEISDILAVDRDKRLLIIELKNTEDRSIIQQLTRYHANLLEAKPFPQEIDYSRPIRLIGITPSYHRHNLIDRLSSRLSFELLQFSIIDRNPSFDFQLEDIDRASAPQGGRASAPKICTITYQAIEKLVVENLPEPPELLTKWLGACTQEEQAGLMLVRNKILGCHQKMKEEVIDKRYIQYGSGKTRLCAEIYFHSKIQKPVLFLWLPLPSAGNRNMQKEKPMIGRIRIWTDGKGISHIGHVPEGFGKMKTPEEWEAIPIEKRPSNWADWSYTSKSPCPLTVKRYLNHSGDFDQDYWSVLSTLAVEKWVEKR
jgi:RecB family endonuclease NucS